MKKLFLLPVFFIGMTAAADPSEEALIARIQKVGTVCVQGTVCAGPQQAIAPAATGGFEVASVYDQSCATCHNLGVAGAPKFADASQWAPRLSKGMDVLYNSAINGMLPAMPARGMCFNCSDDEIKALVDYMVDAAP